jgi:hypothetical protein
VRQAIAARDLGRLEEASMEGIARLRQVAETLRQTAANSKPARLRNQINAIAEQCEAVASALERALLRKALSEKQPGS